MRRFMIGLGVVAMVIAAWLAAQDNPTQRSSARPSPLASSPGPAPSQPLVTPGPPSLATPTIPSFAAGTVTPIAALHRAGQLLFVCGASLCLMNADGAHLKRLVPPNLDGQYATPRWSPDAQEFAAQYFPQWSGAAPKSTGEVVLFSADGAAFASFSPGDAYLLGWPSFTWSPNARWLAFATVWDENGNGVADLGEPSDIRILDRNTWREAFAPLRVGLFAYDVPFAWSPNSRWLAFTIQSQAATPDAIRSEGREILLFDTQSGQTRRIEGTDPTWAMDSEHVAFISSNGQELRTLDLTRGREQTYVTIPDIQSFLVRDDPWLPGGKLHLALPTWSPDDSAIAFRVWGTADEPWPKYFPGMLFILSADKKGLRRLPDTDTPNTALQAWSPLGDRLAYTYWMVGNGRYYPNPATPSPERRFTYKDCCSGLIVYDGQSGTWWDEAGIPSMADDPLSGWSPDGKWFAAWLPGPGRLLIFSVQDPRQRWSFPALAADQIQWQPVR